MNLKKLAAAVCAALVLAAPLTADAHILSSAQEKAMGTKAAKKYEEQHSCREDAILTHIQDRIMSYNKDRLWFYGTPGHKRGLERVLLSDDEHVNATSYGGGQIYIYQGLMDSIAMKEYDNGRHDIWVKSNFNPWKQCNIYQMSALAGVMGHEMAHWENEDMLKQVDTSFAARGIFALIPVANIFTALLTAAGGNVVDVLCSRQLSFDMEKAADEKGITYCAPVPEYSIGSTAAWHYRYEKLFGDSKKATNWLHPHSKSATRVQRALATMGETSKDFFEWKGLDLYMDGKLASSLKLGGERIVLAPRSDVEWRDRTFYVIGQISSCIQYGIAGKYNVQYKPENEVFTDGSPKNTVMIMEGTDHHGRRYTKIIDSYHVPKDKLLRLCGEFERLWDKNDSSAKKGLSDDEINDVYSLVITRKILDTWEDRKYHYMMKVRS